MDASNGQTDLVRKQSHRVVGRRGRGKRQAEVAEEASNRRTAVRSKWEEKSTGANRGVQSRLTVEKSGARVTRYPFKKRKKHHASQIRCTERRFHALIICFDRRESERRTDGRMRRTFVSLSSSTESMFTRITAQVGKSKETKKCHFQTRVEENTLKKRYLVPVTESSARNCCFGDFE
ncbi:hypothetical protein RUM44_009455 [Polyplax serrata]|uniref:Uncharacterized protein n=1 Tax=Polyplax serrata TaxID=468196 RepID=A0ABR1AU87_POLSC